MQIDFKKPRYVLPLVLLPFVCLLFYAYKSGPGKETVKTAGGDSLQTQIARVSEKVEHQGLSDKLDAFRDKFKKGDGYTAVGGIAEEDLTVTTPGSLYNDKEKRMLDSIDGAMKRKFSPFSGNSGSGSKRLSSSLGPGYSKLDQDKALALALSKLKSPPVARRELDLPKPIGADPMQLFRQQMALVDSMGKANDPDVKAAREKERLAGLRMATPAVNPLPARKADETGEDFNTVMPGKAATPLSAVMDQDITGYTSSRLRIRLLDDMLIGKRLVEKGTFIYAVISGFSGQRVLLSINSVFSGGEILPVKLDIYDNDGLPGIYVPASAFREFTRDLGGSSISGISLEQSENNNQLVMGVLGKMFQSTTTAVSKLIRSNKAKLKFNTLVYLIDPNELKNKQNQYK
ncbi:conjugative transposon protein TraM [Pedobacter sp. KBS0701]|uniref:conjugative transposon protein TraM n=1 Tax=Pedobacter sp. KBS0701 TaxID=2578106 RepID=UPI00110E53E1|nr:conjugative transposon protein TraM [Pedobacter sp. KBS0701]QDW27274.1 conjugative transposon protein TraM [Pedobacter sp. KBS0701]